ncbi:thioesterase [Xenorhabdus sp. 12]|uniref:Thioesterase n=1 Tax=Xenorhabdus santafensis TaxID=2582833 RepID=A0ABU4S6C1_9GAMM|nr:alpha/beta fold hydrolase [Xenorhabdus sp. 12]MDX7986003.1 thioesterase [Xenorhabdus sp. 12]
MSDSVLFSVIKKPEAEVQLLFLHHAGGSCFSYMELAHKLSSSIEVYALELAGRGIRIAEPFQTDAETVLSDILASIKHLKLGDDKPLLLFGHSLGAELAYHVARKLEYEAPEKKVVLILSARGFFEPEDLIDDTCEEYSDEYVVNIINQCGGTPQDVLSNPELRDYLIRTMKNDLLLLDSLTRLPKTKLNTNTKVIGGDDDSRVLISQLEKWRKVLPASAEQHVFAGGHFYVFTNKTLIPWLERQLNEFTK